MNKKRIGALLIGATLLVGALGSFAYFTSKTSIGGRGTGELLQKLQIQNGQVVITAEVANMGQGLSDWTYDVAKLSSDTNSEQEGIQYPGNSTVTNFENRHRSPDINVEDNQKEIVDGEEFSRAVIGAKLPENITYTRPGDAIVLGTAKSGSTDVGGLQITNNSNLTIRVRLKVKNLDSAKTQLEAMNEAGWKLYIDGAEVSLNDLNGGIDLGIVGASGTIGSVDIRFELPIDAENDYQNDIAAGGTTGGLNLNDLIEIQATQENNHAWEQIDQDNYTPENN